MGELHLRVASPLYLDRSQRPDLDRTGPRDPGPDADPGGAMEPPEPGLRSAGQHHVAALYMGVEVDAAGADAARDGLEPDLTSFVGLNCNTSEVQGDAQRSPAGGWKRAVELAAVRSGGEPDRETEEGPDRLDPHVDRESKHRATGREPATEGTGSARIYGAS